MDEEDWSDCFITFEQSKERLEAIEQKLALRLGLFGTVEFIRQSLIDLDKQNNLAEDELVQDWHEALSSYLDYLEHRD